MAFLKHEVKMNPTLENDSWYLSAQLSLCAFTMNAYNVYKLADCVTRLPSGRRAEQSLRSPYESGFSMTVSTEG